VRGLVRYLPSNCADFGRIYSITNPASTEYRRYFGACLK